MPHLGSKPRLLTVAEIKAAYGVTDDQVRQHVKRGNLRPKACRMVFTDWEVERWLAESRPRRRMVMPPEVEREFEPWEVQPKRVKFGE